MEHMRKTNHTRLPNYMTMIKHMTIRNKILMVITAVLMLCSVLITSVWYTASSKMADTYLKDISGSTMRDACQAFEYLLTDTSYMAAMVSLNDRNIIRPVKALNERTIMENGQWNMEYLKNRRIIKEFINDLNGYKYYIVGIGVIVNEGCTFSTSHLVEGQGDVYERIMGLDQDRLKKNIVMLEPILITGSSRTCFPPTFRREAGSRLPMGAGPLFSPTAAMNSWIFPIPYRDMYIIHFKQIMWTGPLPWPCHRIIIRRISITRRCLQE